jgi:PPOX class probable F420-dependent enzyme
MSVAEREAFLAGTHVAVLTIARPDGRAPLAAPIWYEYEPGGDVVMTIGAGSEKAALLEQASVASLCAQSEALPYRFVTVDGPVAVVPADDASRRRIAERYLPAELVDGYLASGSSADMRNVRLTPASWRSNDFSKLSEPSSLG